MKKLFLPLALLTMSTVVAESAETAAAEQQQAEYAYLQNAGAQLAAKLLENPIIAAWYNEALDEEIKQFNDICVRYATLNIIANQQLAPHYNQIFNELIDLTGQENWLVQLTFGTNSAVQQDVGVDMDDLDDADEDDADEDSN